MSETARIESAVATNSASASARPSDGPPPIERRTQQEANISFYKVKDCGYYHRETRAHQFCDLGSTLRQLHKWISQPNVTLQNTCTFQIVADRDQLGVYCVGMTQHPVTKDWLLTLWNAVETTDDQIASIAGDSVIGQPRVDLQKPPAGHIPGFATHFWFIPDKNAVATVRLKHLSTAPAAMTHYLQGFLRSSTSHVVSETDDEGITKVIGYRQDSKDASHPHLPRFSTGLWKRKETYEAIRAKRTTISKVIRKAELDRTQKVEGDILNNFFRLLGLTRFDTVRRTKVRLRNELAIKPSEGELNEILAEWDKGLETEWADIGFQFEGNPKKLWLSHAYIRQALQLELLWKNAELADQTSLLTELTRFRDSLLPMLKEG